MASYYEPLHPAMLQVLASVASAAKANSMSISICGEMAGNPAYTQLLLGLGFRSLSVSPSEILEIKNAIRSISMQQAEDFTRRILHSIRFRRSKIASATTTCKSNDKSN